ncbi:unnamed protein product [Parnassius apollo]|uniref:(apollo) hypothetical protein n=1 Tax=Parnassius apollo TaxID=110799 RepID=A0A8S3XV03_PARAO|nr:unnamed protein product [Parnassius apollo]
MTETTVATATTAASEENGQKDEAAQKETTKKTPEDILDKGVHGSATTLKPKGVSRGHFLVDCQKFQKMSVQDRWATVKKSHVCFKCLQGKHRKESCKKPPCKECKMWHHHLLHVDSENRTSGEKKA